jgi:quercetin dioxygenase-like cupin family protein
MLRRSIPAALLVALALALPVGALAHGAAPAGPTVAHQATFPNLTMTGQFDELMVVLDFAPGAGVPLHVHGGPTLVTVLEGAITLREKGAEKTYKAGESWTEMSGNRHEAANPGPGKATVVVTFLLAKGAEPTTLQGGAQPSAPGPTVRYQAQFANLALPGQFDEVLVVLDFAPGAGVPLHVHGGPTLVTVLDGAITLAERGAQQAYKAGESWTETPGNRHEAVNAGTTAARVVVTFLLPKGAEATTLVAPGLPNTGAGGAADWAAVGRAAAILGPGLTLISLLGWRLRRRSTTTQGDRA